MKNSIIAKTITISKPKTKEQIAMEMDIHPKTLLRRLKKVGLSVPRGLVSPKMQEEIYRQLGWLNTVS